MEGFECSDRTGRHVVLIPDNDEPGRTHVENGAYSKHRREDALPLHSSLVVFLRPWLAGRPANQPLWPGKWASGKEAGVMLKHDLKAAGIPYIDESGRYGDFHALRHTFITNLVKSGVTPKVAQALARHSTIDLTMNVYTSLTVQDQASALASLAPIVPLHSAESAAEVLRATGTDGAHNGADSGAEGAGNGAVHLAPKPLRIAPNCTETPQSRPEHESSENAKNPE